MPSIVRAARATFAVEPEETRAVALSFLFFFFFLGSYYILRPVRDALGTVYGVDHLQELYTGTALGTLLASAIYGAFASRIRLAVLLPAVYGLFLASILAFYLLFAAVKQDRWVAAAFYVWVSVFNLILVSVFWSFMADLFSQSQSKRLFGLIASGGSLGGITGPAVATFLAEVLGNNGLLLISAVGFLLAILLLRLLENEKARLRATALDAGQPTTLERKLGGNPFAGFSAVATSPYLLLIAVFVLFGSWVSVILYFQQADLISHAFVSREARTRAFASVDLAVNVGAVVLQMFGTGRFTTRFGIVATLIINPVLMIFAFALVAASPVLMVLLGTQVVRRVCEFSFAKPGRDMLFTAVDQESRYKAKNVIDAPVYRASDLSAAWITAGLRAIGLGVGGVAVFGIAVSAVWAVAAVFLGRGHERKSGAGISTATSAA